MLKSCKYCMRIHDRKFDCGKKPKRIKNNEDVAVKFRNTSAWRKKSVQIKERDNYLCQVCLQKKELTYDELEVHHIVPIVEDYELRLDDDNLITLCESHHEEAERGEISRDKLRKLTPPGGVTCQFFRS